MKLGLVPGTVGTLLYLPVCFMQYFTSIFNNLVTLPYATTGVGIYLPLIPSTCYLRPKNVTEKTQGRAAECRVPRMREGRKGGIMHPRARGVRVTYNLK